MKANKMNNHTLRGIGVCMCVVVSEMRAGGQGQHECVCMCVWVRIRQARCYFLGQAARQQGGIITEAVTFLWFLWFQHEAGGWLWLTHGLLSPSISLRAGMDAAPRGQYVTFLGSFNLRDINYKSVNLRVYFSTSRPSRTLTTD